MHDQCQQTKRAKSDKQQALLWSFLDGRVIYALAHFPNRDSSERQSPSVVLLVLSKRGNRCDQASSARLLASHPHRGAHAADRARGCSRCQRHSCASRRRGTTGRKKRDDWVSGQLVAIPRIELGRSVSRRTTAARLRGGAESHHKVPVG